MIFKCHDFVNLLYCYYNVFQDKVTYRITGGDYADHFILYETLGSFVLTKSFMGLPGTIYNVSRNLANCNKRACFL